ncbi:MAG: hypothetical protein HYS13_04710 [Planctomycetia bacterium]|nr:hypothetical protein [Planctomycetia bacterium]
MPVKIECPHCRISLAVPSKYIGGVAACPQCGGAFQVPAQGAGKLSDSDVAEFGSNVAQSVRGGSAATATVAPAQSVAAPTAASGTQSTFRANPSPSPAAAAAMLPPAAMPSGPASPQAAPAPTRLTTTARFITADTARSSIQPERDGRLPELALDQLDHKKRTDSRSSSSNPAFMTAAIVFSILASVLLLLVDFESSKEVSQSKEESRRKIQMEFAQSHHPNCPARLYPYKGCTCDPPPPLLEYQQLLRLAEQAHARGDVDEERRMYRRVLRMLRNETKTRHGLTGSPQTTNRDADLEALIGRVLQED